MAGCIRRFCGRDAARAAWTAIEVAARQRNELFLPPGRGILDAGQLLESITAEI